jgi:hypothetical protein
MKKMLIMAAALAAFVSPAYAVDMDIYVPEVTTIDGGAPKGTDTFIYVWFQGQSEAEMRQVGETPAPRFARTNQADTMQCFAAEIINTSRPTATEPRGVRSERSVTTCQDFSPTAPAVIGRPDRPGAPVVTRRPSA